MSIRKPIIAAINGAVAGMAVPIVLACDLRFMNADAVLTTSFAQRGLIAEWGISWLLARLVGPSDALDLLFSARKVGATRPSGSVSSTARSRRRGRGGRAGLHRRARRALLAGVDRGDEAPGLPRPAPRARPAADGGREADGRELRTTRLRRGRAVVPRPPGSRVPARGRRPRQAEPVSARRRASGSRRPARP